MPSPRRRDRGSALIVAMILMVVLAMVGLAIVNRTTSEVDAVASKRHYDRNLACVEGARQMLLSQFRTYGINLASMTMQRAVGDQLYTTGHYDTFNVTSVQLAAGSPGQLVTSSSTNVIVKGNAGLGGKAWRFTVVCSDAATHTHQQEVEFLVNFGF